MPLNVAESKETLLERLKTEIRKRLPDNKSELLNQFVDSYYRNTPEMDLQKWRPDDLLGATLHMWEFVQDASVSTPRVKVFNPDFERHGWQSTHTVIAVVSEDRPFIIDSLRMELNRQDVSIHAINNVVLSTQRNNKGLLTGLNKSDSRGESVVAIEVDRHTDPQRLEQIRVELLAVLDEVRAAVDDFDLMLAAVKEQTEHLKKQGSALKKQDLSEASEFLDWMHTNFTFLGYEVFELKKSGKKQTLEPVEGSGLGLLRDCNQACREKLLDADNLNADQHTLLPDLISFSKAAAKSRIHRPAYPDYISFKRFDEQGKVVGEVRFLGLYTSSVYLHSPRSIPVIRNKISTVMQNSGLYPQGHDWKELNQILETFPRDDLFQMQVDELSAMTLGILEIRERRQIRVFLRRDKQGHYFSALVYVPREIYSTEFRVRSETILKRMLNCELAEFTTYFSESILARTQFNLRRADGETVIDQYDVADIEHQIREAARSWDEDLYDALTDAMGEEQGIHSYNHFNGGFPASYRAHFSARTAVIDIQHMRSMTDSNPIALSFYRALDREEDEINFKLFHYGNSLPLSDVLPILENLGLRVIDEHPYEIQTRDQCIWIHDFNLRYGGKQHASIEALQDTFEDAFLNIWKGACSSDDFNKLVLGAGLGWRQVKILRAYAAYMKQIRFPISTEAVSAALNNHVGIAAELINLFYARFEPETADKQNADAVEERILEALESVASLNEDQVIRQYLILIKATLRTNFFQKKEGVHKSYISFKLSPAEIPVIPQPRPMFEIFVFSPRVEGVHLRGGKVARGGLRWSDRNEDFRTEVLGLVKAQQVKNAVIVPVGAKGGFVAKQLHPGMSRDEWLEEGITCYRMFISALLDITDNLVEGEVVPPSQVVRHDEDDTYLVVAADKGTATFSDIANSIAEEYNFWLGDAFASGGSQGYDHKKMGITAKGAWVSVERHFRELGHNTRTEPFTVVGIGDMSGDVFGNGMLLSDQIKLIAAFNHLHIFFDPDPDPASSFAERQRLFDLPRSGWNDYDKSLISKGGGIFERSAKSIRLTPEMKKWLGVSQAQMTPNDLISAILKSQFDLLWNGGIGTYVKASHESHADVGDKANDGLRVDGCDLQCRVIGEGGNLGMTQMGRMEYARNGGRLNTDFIDNAGGVDCSDHEVNIKILLNGMVAAGDMTLKQRNKLLVEMTDEVSSLVLKNNYRQVQAITLAERRSLVSMSEYQRFISKLESQGKLNRKLEYLPADEVLDEQRLAGKGLSRPELSVLVSYSKADLKERLLQTELPDDAYVARELVTAFPRQMREQFADGLKGHRLCREIVSTQVANEIVNLMGINFADRLAVSTGASVEMITRAYVLVRDTFRLKSLWKQIELLDYQVDATIQLEMMERLQYLARHATRWFLRNRRGGLDCEQEHAVFAKPLQQVAEHLGELLCGDPKAQWEAAYQRYTDAGVPADLAKVVAGSGVLFSALGVIEVAREQQVDMQRAAQAFFGLGERLQLHWFAMQLNDLSVENYWQALARDAFRDDLDWQQRALMASLLKLDASAKTDTATLLEQWIELNQPLLERWDKVLSDLKVAKTQDYAMYTVAVRELYDLARTCIFTSD
ncbi:NAD-specific glutamate dehydrogenase, large form [Nitrincola lacisaponensis]|uniref:NAD-specific glutamate dehydrogenase, large form n=1 Tax=Nitrincola lacisaponensis TaxID=267850 RepID=A0A063Y330_9GAMM|nr:NAD-glutamate dehydrogenase [Nitrincola lacisaponensis]KDE39181.1 NAD-specific glutamate dehydrogenase, large form [Nitrincola lacisaponensis]